MREAGSICAARSEDPASDCPSYGRSAGSTDVDPRPQPDRSSADSGSERGARIGQALRLPASGLVDLVLRQAEFGRASAWSCSGARSGARADRGDDEEDQALRPADQGTHGDDYDRLIKGLTETEYPETQALIQVY